MPHRPSVVIFDVNGTLSDLSPLDERFVALGLPPGTVHRWLSAVLRDGIALTAAGGSAGFAEIAEGVLGELLTGHRVDRDAAVAELMAGFLDLPVHPDVPDGIRALRTAGFRLVTLSNGSTEVGAHLLEVAGIRSDFEELLSVADAGAWKPSRAAYEYALRRCAVPATDALLVAVHPWDIDGAARAGLATAWLDRDGSPYPSYFRPPDHTVTALTELAVTLAAA